MHIERWMASQTMLIFSVFHYIKPLYVIKE